ncbi:MAG: sugar phosphate isomerase/epimerase family protein [Acidimicrobiia bacterium]
MGIILHTMATPELDPRGAVALAAGMGLDGIELIIQDGYRCGLAQNASERAAREIGATAAGHGVPIRVLVCYEKGACAQAAEERSRAVDALRRAIDLAVAAGASGVRVLAGREEVNDAGFPAAAGRMAETLRALSDHAAPHPGFSLLVENHMDCIATSAARTVAICDATARKNVGVLFDPANLATLGAEDFSTSYALQRHLVRHVHVKDAVVEEGRRRSVAPGLGSDPWPAVIQSLVRDGYSGDFSLDYERRWLPDLPPAELALPAAKRFLQACIADAKGRFSA